MTHILSHPVYELDRAGEESEGEDPPREEEVWRLDGGHW
jgi:hypothetical protein